ncbi:MAG: prepilin-type N-terminal cleavage/methylation domain-containing protein [Gemmatimonadota bacterium]|nr:prepilin-type N-terminal cleavage/methylation domain-containing protein [Gemmatimonadota bacterium]
MNTTPSATPRGFTLIETLAVLAIIGILGAIGVPTLMRSLSGPATRSAKQQVAAYLVRTRAAAIENGQPALFVRTGNSIQVLLDQGGTKVAFSPAQNLGTMYGVTVTASRDTIQYDPRGFASTLSGTATILVTQGSKSDSVCVLGLGRISTIKCGL